jgi:hypothetical protein
MTSKRETRLAPTSSNINEGDYTQKDSSTIASGATTIGSAERAPDNIYH